MADAIVRTCPTCGENFLSKSTKKCKPCAKAYNASWYAANRAKVAARVKAQRGADPKKYAAKCAAWRQANPDKAKAGYKAYYEANRERAIEASKSWQRRHPKEVVARNIAAYQRQDRKKRNAEHAAWCAANPEKVTAWSRAWRAANPERRRVHHMNRKMHKKTAGKLSVGIVVKLLKLQRGLCACCGEPLGKSYHLDHRVPLARGGANEDSNMQLLRQRCNNQKCARDPIEFMQSRGFLI